MKVLVHAGSLEGDARALGAALGLAARGHAVHWLGEKPEAAAGLETLTTGEPGLALARQHADVVVGGGAHPQTPAVAGALARAHAMVVSLDRAAFQRWRPLEWFGWSALHATALVDEREAGTFQQDPRGLDLERIALWSGAAPPAGIEASHPDVDLLERACERALARHRGRSPRPAVFLDRDGTLIEEVGYLDDPDRLRLLPGVVEGLTALRQAGFALVVVSNQAGVGRGYYPIEVAHRTMARLRAVLRARGIELDAVTFCPHAPDEGCACRKPGIELVERAAEDLLLRPGRSYVIGDKRLDVETARRAGATGLLVRSGHGRDEERAAREAGETPAVFDDLGAAAAWIVTHDHPADAG